MAEEKSKDETLSREISQIALRLGRQATNAKPDQKTNILIAIGLINHAQILVGMDNARARRLTSQAKRIGNIK